MALLIANLKAAYGCFVYPWHPHLWTIYKWVACRYNNPKITSAYREEPTSIHGTNPLRAFDLSDNNFEHPELLEEDVNNHWVYDPMRPDMTCCWWHKNRDSEGCHLHFQVHDRTRLVTLT